MSFFLFKKQPSLSFVFDIRDASISLAVARFEKNKKPEIVLCQNFELKYQDSKDQKKYLSFMLKTLDDAIVSVKRGLIKIGNKENIGKYYFFIGSPWSVSQTKTIKIIKEKLFEINNDVMSKILLGEESIIEKKIEEQTKEPNWKILEEKIIQSKLNGYKVDDIFGKKTSNFTIELFVSFIPYEIKEKITSHIDEEKQKNSCILSSYSYLRDLYSDKNDFIYVDIGKLLTDVYVVRDDIIFGIASFPFGEEDIIKMSLSKTNLSKDVFLSYINIGQDNNFDLSSHNNGEDLLKTGIYFWENQLKDSLSKICTEMNIPNNLFIIANGVIPSILIKELFKKSNQKFEIFGSKIDVLIIGENIINNYVLNGKFFANEPYIKMDLIFLYKILKRKQ